jgi:DNA-directed RNA polymerase specialized sigma24 family protein
MSDAVYLRAEASRCFRLATGPVSMRLADKLEALGRTFEQEAREIEACLLHWSAQQRASVSQHYVEALEMAEPV